MCSKWASGDVLICRQAFMYQQSMCTSGYISRCTSGWSACTWISACVTNHCQILSTTVRCFALCVLFDDVSVHCSSICFLACLPACLSVCPANDWCLTKASIECKQYTIHVKWTKKQIKKLKCVVVAGYGAGQCNGVKWSGVEGHGRILCCDLKVKYFFCSSNSQLVLLVTYQPKKTTKNKQ